MLIPYRCKNPPEYFPYATIGLIAVNVLVYMFTTHSLLVVKDGDVADFGLAPSNVGPFRLITSIFLHAEPLHIIGNMLFLWLFGAAVEGRMRIPKFLTLYFLSGIVGGLAECMYERSVGSDAPGLGASGAIMGLAGAYIYIFPYARIMIFRISLRSLMMQRSLTFEWLAWWVVAYYMGLNVLNAILANALHISGGTAYFAHFGGFLTGLLLAFAFRVRRDAEHVSKAQAIRSDARHDYSIMNVHELASLLEAPTENMDIVVAYCGKAIINLGDAGDKKAIAMLETYKQQLLARADPVRLAQVVLSIPKASGGVSGPFYLRLGGKLEQLNRDDTAVMVYRQAYELFGVMPDGGAAVVRLARLWESKLKSYDDALDAYEIYVEYFPAGPLLEDAQKGVARIKALKALPPPQRTVVQRQTVQSQVQPAENQADGNAVILPRTVATPDLAD
jgi:membrane associated rhomboid family serine protease